MTKPPLRAIPKRDPMKITEPMRIVLINAQLNDGVVADSYPTGQMRTITAGLQRRGLIEPHPDGKRWRLTTAGWGYGR